MSIDKNIAALLREDLQIVEVQFKSSDSIQYSYLEKVGQTKVGDYVVVPTTSKFGLAKVTGHREPGLNEDFKLKPIVQVVDVEPFDTLCGELDALEKAVAVNYRSNARASMRQALLGGASPEVLALIGGAK